MARTAPHLAAEAIGAHLQEHCPLVERYGVVKGFLNLVLTGDYWNGFLTQAVADARFGFAEPGSKPLVMVEYSSPNTNKPLHLGHLRNNFLGYAVARILEAVGHEVQKVQIINDRGIHICKSMVAWQRLEAEKLQNPAASKGTTWWASTTCVLTRSTRPSQRPDRKRIDADKAEQQAELLKRHEKCWSSGRTKIPKS